VKKRNVHRLLVGNVWEQRPLGRPRCRWVDNIKTDLEEIGWGLFTVMFWLRIKRSGELL
jgi:hypothetical protein